MLRKPDKPPYGNTGAQNTYPESLRACVDWAQGTFPQGYPPLRVIEVLGIPEDLFMEMDRGAYGYRRCLRFGNISIYFDGKESMGTHFEMTGQGCRLFEKVSKNGWDYFFYTVLRDGHFTRLDVAIDDFEGYFTIGQVIDSCRKGLVSSKFKKAINIESVYLDDGRTCGQTVYFGSPTSRIKVRFYDKLNERIQAGKTIENGIKFWNRTEIEMRDERANEFAEYLMMDYRLEKLVKGVLRNYLLFRKKGTDSNKSRWPVAKWWENFLGDVEKLRLARVAPDRTVEKIDAWIHRQVKKSLAILFKAYDSDLYYLTRIIAKGLEELTDYDKAIIQAYKEMIDRHKNEKSPQSETIDTETQAAMG